VIELLEFHQLFAHLINFLSKRNQLDPLLLILLFEVLEVGHLALGVLVIIQQPRETKTYRNDQQKDDSNKEFGEFQLTDLLGAFRQDKDRDFVIRQRESSI
jgi:hypothetical protein